MMSLPEEPCKVFCAYAPADEALCRELEKHLKILERQGWLSLWHHRKILPGEDWVASLDEYLNEADIILFLVTPDFLASAYCYGVEMKRALQRHEAHEARVIPLLLRPSVWKSGPFAHLAPLPGNTEAVSLWPNVDAAFVDIASGIQQVIRTLLPSAGISPVRLEKQQPGVHRQIWNVPFPRNPFFLGRDELLTVLRMQLRSDKSLVISQPQAISGMGGVGKTQLVLEYAYRFADDYQVVFWANAESSETLLAGFQELAGLLSLPEHDEHGQAVVISVVKAWLSQHDRWLLVLDNAADLTWLMEFLPTHAPGHVILTTRAQAVRQFAHRLEVDVLEEKDAVLLLLRRADLLANDASLEQIDATSYSLAQKLCKKLDSLPLALDQAGAYIDETKCSLQDYLDLLHKHRTFVLSKRRMTKETAQDHKPVATTWSLSFATVRRESAVAADLLCLCAVLHPDAIPEELVLQRVSELGDGSGIRGSSNPLTLDEALAVLTNYSLLRRNNRDRTLSIHRLVQAVLQDTMSTQERKTWVQWTVQVLNRLFPRGDHTAWSQCERLLPHALICLEQTSSLDQDISMASLLFTVARYLHQRTRYAEAEPLYKRALQIYETLLEPEHLEVSYPLNGMAHLYKAQGKYAEAETLYKRALRIREAHLGSGHLDVAYPLNGLAHLYKAQERYAEAETLYKRALDIREAHLGSRHPDVAYSLYNLANLRKEQVEHGEAELLYMQALQIYETSLGPEHPDVASPLNGLASLYAEQEKYAEAEPLYARALRVCKKSLGPEHLYVASPLNNLATLYKVQGKYAEAEPLYAQALQIYEASLGPEHLYVASTLDNLANLYKAQGKYAQAKPLYARALRIYEINLGSMHTSTVQVRSSYERLFPRNE